jgi:hypothetical protein
MTGVQVEFCSCGHVKNQHAPSELAQIEGHGECNLCNCQRFTWEKTITI